MPATNAIPCHTCEGSGTNEVPFCRRGSDHAGHDCGGTVCGTYEVECERCGGGCVETCTDCGQAPAVVEVPDPRFPTFPDMLCAGCAEVEL